MDKKEKNKKSKAKYVLIILELAIVFVIIIPLVNSYIISKERQKTAEVRTAAFALEYYFSNSKIEFMEKYKKYRIYKLSIKEDIYFVGFDISGESISKNNVNILDYEGDIRIIYKNKSETVWKFYDKKSDGSEKYVVTLFNEKNELKDTIDNNS